MSSNDGDAAYRAHREAGNRGPWNHDAGAPADETNTPREQLEILARLRDLPSWDSYGKNGE
jgi:hypothetical protein